MGAPIEVPTDVPDADAAEQAQAIRPDEAPNQHFRPAPDDVDEYDAVEQSIVVEVDDDEYR